MKKILAVALSMILALSCLYTGAFALTGDDLDSITTESANLALDTNLEKMNGRAVKFMDVDKDGKVTAKDARLILLRAAKIDTKNSGYDYDAQAIDGFTLGDADNDGKITSSDARCALRYSANLISDAEYYSKNASLQTRLDLFNSIANSIKPNSTVYQSNIKDTTDNITYTNKSTIDSLTRQLNKMAKLAGQSDTIDIGKEITSAIGDTTYTNYRYGLASVQSGFPIYPYKYSSTLDTDDITGIDYKTNQCCTFTMKAFKTTDGKTQEYDTQDPITITGLDSVTVYLKDDLNLQTIPSGTDIETVHAGNAFNLPDNSDLTSGIDDVNKELTSGTEEIKDFLSDNHNTLDLKASIKGIDFKGSYITYYFYILSDKDGNQKILPIVADYNLKYDYTVSMKMNIDLRIKVLSFFRLEAKNKTVDITNYETTKSTYFFNENYNIATANK